jgi:hypothetical protein
MAWGRSIGKNMALVAERQYGYAPVDHCASESQRNEILTETIMKSDHKSYLRFTGKSRVEKSINTLLGLIDGISVDSEINRSEIEFLNIWINENSELQGQHPFNELLPLVTDAISDGVLTSDEKYDIEWLASKILSNKYYDSVTAGLQRLHGVLAGIAADSVITEGELRGLSEWLSAHDHLKTCWPYEEVATLVTNALSQKQMSRIQHDLLLRHFSEFSAIYDERTITNPALKIDNTIVGLCAVCPDISFTNRRFCFTGSSYKYSRNEFSRVVIELGGDVTNIVSKNLDYLIIGADGNPCWAYACYGRKVEKAVEFRRQGARLLLVHENDFHDAVSDL